MGDRNRLRRTAVRKLQGYGGTAQVCQRYKISVEISKVMRMAKRTTPNYP